MLNLDATAVSLIISLVIPVLTGLVTKVTLPGAAKGVLTLVLNGVAALVTTATLADGTAVLSGQTVVTWLIGLGVSVAMYLGVWKPAGVTSSAPDGKLAPNAGLGPTTP
jgi:hypothetical protein